MSLNEHDRKQLLEDLGLATDGETLAMAPAPDEPTQEQPEQPAIQTGVESLTDEQLLEPGAFDKHKLKASEVGRAVSSPHNKRLYARIQETIERQRAAHDEARREQRKQAKAEQRTHVREKVKADTANRAAQTVLEAMQEAGIDLDQLAKTLQDKEPS